MIAPTKAWAVFTKETNVIIDIFFAKERSDYFAKTMGSYHVVPVIVTPAPPGDAND